MLISFINISVISSFASVSYQENKLTLPFMKLGPTKLNDASCQLSLMILDNPNNNNTIIIRAKRVSPLLIITEQGEAVIVIIIDYYWLLLLFGGSTYWILRWFILNCASKACLGVWIRQYNPVPRWADWQKEAEMWSDECRIRRGSQRTTYELHTYNIDWETANKLLEMQSCTPPQDN